MNEDCLQEIQGIRETQRDLRSRMWVLDGRIDNVGQQLAKVVTKAAPRTSLYRWIALGVLALAIGRLFLFDVWQLDTIFRIVSFLVLGAVLLALGFLYNRLAGLIRKWM